MYVFSLADRHGLKQSFTHSWWHLDLDNMDVLFNGNSNETDIAKHYCNWKISMCIMEMGTSGIGTL